MPAALTALLALAPRPRQEPARLDARSFAQRVEVAATPVHAFRYNQPIPAPNQTKALLSRRRAFYPGERVSLAFRLPQGATLAAPLRARVGPPLHDLLGARLAELGEAALSAALGRRRGHARVDGARGGGGPVPARRALLGRGWRRARVPEQRRLRDAGVPAAAGGSARGPRPGAGKAATADALVRDISLPSTEMLVEDAEMRWSDFGQAPRDWDFVKQPARDREGLRRSPRGGRGPWKGRTGAFTKAYRSEVDGTLQPYALYVPPSYDAAKAWPMVVGLHGSGSNHLLHRRRLFGLGNAPGEQDYDAIRTDVSYPDVGFVVLAPYGRGESAGYYGVAEADVLRAMDHVQRAYHVDPDRVHLTGLSMGGGGTWHIGLRYPDRFASISPVCGVADMDLMPLDGGLERARPGADGPHRLHADRRERREPAGLRVPRRRGRRRERHRLAQMMEAFEKAGLAGRSAHYFELPGVTHFAWDFAYRDAGLFRRVAASAATRPRSASSTRPSRLATTRPTGSASTGSTAA